ncbi:hypothetical protein C7M84_005046 [Penaeus vannamei]|uniref:Uncharacterized protein n=1 Tax=Penaeus vannamei TaxID=6689 RepID=A0A3R7P5W4_PENVA|nr:hypothetical protein C7M84_005046 [Penaeus vannamei]
MHRATPCNEGAGGFSAVSGQVGRPGGPDLALIAAHRRPSHHAHASTLAASAHNHTYPQSTRSFDHRHDLNSVHDPHTILNHTPHTHRSTTAIHHHIAASQNSTTTLTHDLTAISHDHPLPLPLPHPVLPATTCPPPPSPPFILPATTCPSSPSPHPVLPHGEQSISAPLSLSSILPSDAAALMQTRISPYKAIVKGNHRTTPPSPPPLPLISPPTPPAAAPLKSAVLQLATRGKELATTPFENITLRFLLSWTKEQEAGGHRRLWLLFSLSFFSLSFHRDFLFLSFPSLLFRYFSLVFVFSFHRDFPLLLFRHFSFAFVFSFIVPSLLFRYFSFAFVFSFHRDFPSLSLLHLSPLSLFLVRIRVLIPSCLTLLSLSPLSLFLVRILVLIPSFLPLPPPLSFFVISRSHSCSHSILTSSPPSPSLHLSPLSLFLVRIRVFITS